MSDIGIRIMGESDLDSAIALSCAAGWNQTAEDWRRVLHYQRDGCFVALSENKLVGTVTTTCYEDPPLAWIGMMLVDEDHRRRGIGRLLMQRALEFLDAKQIDCVKLDATPLGEPLYQLLGFETEWTFHRWRRDGDDVAPKSFSDAGEFEAMNALDLRAFGSDRCEFLRRLSAGSLVHREDNAFGMLRAGRIADYLGPLVCESADAAESIVDMLLSKTTRPVFWDIPGPNETAEELAKTRGFEPVRDLTRMVRGGESREPQVQLQFALADPAVG